MSKHAFFIICNIPSYISKDQVHYQTTEMDAFSANQYLCADKCIFFEPVLIIHEPTCINVTFAKYDIIYGQSLAQCLLIYASIGLLRIVLFFLCDLF